MKKRLLASVLAVCLFVGLAIPAFAADPTDWLVCNPTTITAEVGAPQTITLSKLNGENDREQGIAVISATNSDNTNFLFVAPTHTSAEDGKDYLNNFLFKMNSTAGKTRDFTLTPKTVGTHKTTVTFKYTLGDIKQPLTQTFEFTFNVTAPTTTFEVTGEASPSDVPASATKIIVKPNATFRNYWAIGEGKTLIAEAGANLRWSEGVLNNLFVGAGGTIEFTDNGTFTVKGKANDKADYILAGNASVKTPVTGPLVVDESQTFTVASGKLTVNAAKDNTGVAGTAINYVPTLSVHSNSGKLLINSGATLELLDKALVVLGNGSNSILLNGTLTNNAGTYDAITNIVGFVDAKGTPVTVTKPTPPTPPYTGGGSSNSGSSTAEDTNNSGTKIEVLPGVTNVTNPVLTAFELPVWSATSQEFAAAAKEFSLVKTFMINLYDSTTKVTQVEGGKIKVEIPFTGTTGKEYIVLRYNDDKTITELKATYVDGKISFETDHFSTYAVAVKTDVAPEKNPTTPPKTGDTTPISVVLVLAVLAGGLVISRKKLCK
ncbi:MAG: LPXTG cell wall anchor domain-containing protein [Oscillospiraceae bacterium]